MTVKELIEINQMITDVQITVRENGTLLLDQLNIGPYEGEKPRFPMRVPKDPKYAGQMDRHDDYKFKDAAYIPKSINSWDDGKDYWQVKVNRIPASWLELEVFSWSVSPASSVTYHSPRRQNYEGKFKNINFHGQRIDITALPNGQKLSVPKEKPKHDAEEQLDGQMSIEDWDYEVVTI